MSIIVDGRTQPADAESRRLQSTIAAEPPSGPVAARPPATPDWVEASSEAQLVTLALHAAQDTAAVRPDAVESARRALDDGTLGRDTNRLAERIIDSLLSE
jgi:anti-sigma28 factor (negative regulator of flagellin synthesis)